MKKLNILIGCEESQIVTKELRAKGHSAFSCDIQECSGDRPEWHLRMDVFKAIIKRKWDIIILHPPCTAIAVSGNRHYGKGKLKYNERLQAVKWTEDLWKLATYRCKKVALENPVGVLNQLSTIFPVPYYIQPWQFGHGEVKKTGWWLHNLPPLKPTSYTTSGREQRIWKMPPSPNRGKERSKTYVGIAKAIANQWTK